MWGLREPMLQGRRKPCTTRMMTNRRDAHCWGIYVSHKTVSDTLCCAGAKSYGIRTALSIYITISIYSIAYIIQEWCSILCVWFRSVA